MIETNDPLKRLILDIETSPMTLKGFGLRDQNFGLDQLIVPTRMLSFAAKWFDNGEDIAFYADFNNDPDDKYEMVTAAWDLINEANVVIHFNGKSFDMKHINREFVEVGLGPPKPYQQVDLLKVARKHFYLPSYKLDYILRWLGHEGKVKHAGFVMWNDVMEGDEKARKLFEEYNIGDILRTQLVYVDFMAWIDDHPNAQLFLERGDNPICPTCTSIDVVKDGTAPRGNLSRVQCYRCKSCGRSFRGSQTLIRAEER